MTVKAAMAVALAVGVLIVGLVGMAQADVVALEAGGFTSSFSSASTVGWEFSLSSPVEVTALGYLDFNGHIMQDNHDVAIWNATGTTLLASATVLPTDPGADGYLFHAITPVSLPAGTYVIGAMPSADDPWGNGATTWYTNSPVTWVQEQEYYLSGSLVFPSESYGAPQAYSAPNFQFTAVPAPAALLLLGSGLAGLAFMRRRLGE